MEKSAEAYRTISEVAQDLDLPQHVLRFWETRFIQIKPLKRGGGRRYYRPEDIDLLRAIRHLLYGEGYTIKGVQKILKEQGARAIAAAYGGSGVLAPAPAERIAQDFEDDWDDESADLAAGEPGAPAYAPASAPTMPSATMSPPTMPPPAMSSPGMGSQSPQATAMHTAATHAASAPAFSKSTRDSLQELLAELADCARILDVARSG
jgi:DNA-binding transcriptional MerR regulator